MRNFIDRFETCEAPDEYYFGTVLNVKGWPLTERVVPEDVTWTDWATGKAHPRTHEQVSPALAAKLASSGRFFARKFAPAAKGLEILA